MITGEEGEGAARVRASRPQRGARGACRVCVCARVRKRVHADEWAVREHTVRGRRWGEGGTGRALHGGRRTFRRLQTSFLMASRCSFCMTVAAWLALISAILRSRSVVDPPRPLSRREGCGTTGGIALCGAASCAREIRGPLGAEACPSTASAIGAATVLAANSVCESTGVIVIETRQRASEDGLSREGVTETPHRTGLCSSCSEVCRHRRMAWCVA